MNGRQQQQQQHARNNRANIDHDPLDFLSALGAAHSMVAQNIAEEGYNPKKITVDADVFNDLVVQHLDQLKEKDIGENAADAGDGHDNGYYSDDEESQKRVDRLIGNKEEGDSFTVTQHFIYQGTLNEFKNGLQPTTITQSCPALESAPHRPVTKSSRVTMMQNSTPFPINFKMNGVASSNIQMDHNSDTYKNVTYKIPPNAITPMSVNTSIFEQGDGVAFEIDDMQLELAYTTDAEIQASIQFPAISDFIGEGRTPTASQLEKYEQSKATFAKADQCFVAKSAPLGRYITMATDIGSRVPMGWEDRFPDHYLMPQFEVAAHIANMKETLEESPIGKLHGMTGTITRHDGQDWDHIPNGIPEEEANFLLNSRQTIQVTVEHDLMAILG